MSESIKNRAAAIRQYLGNIEQRIDPALIYRYSITAARWEAIRLRIDRGQVTPGDDQRFRDLAAVLRVLTHKLGLETAGEDTTDPNGVPGITMYNGFLPRDPGRIIFKTWQEAAEGW